MRRELPKKTVDRTVETDYADEVSDVYTAHRVRTVAFPMVGRNGAEGD